MWRSLYIDQLECFVRERNKHLMCKLNKIVYMLLQWPRAWYHRFDLFSIKEGFWRNDADRLSYIKQTGKQLLMLIST